MKLLLSLVLTTTVACVPVCVPSSSCNPEVEYCRCEKTNSFPSNSYTNVHIVLPDFPSVVDNGKGSSNVNDGDWDVMSDDSNGDNSDE